MTSKKLLAALVAGLIGIAASGCGAAEGTGEGAASAALEGVRTVEIEDRTHVEGEVDYPDEPPLGGPHNAVWVNCGRYDQPVPNELAVHALEHGAVWITHPTGLSDAELSPLDELAANQSHVLVSPLPGATATTATAWGAQLEVESADDPDLATFIETYLQGPQTPEPGAPCSGGVGQPVT